MESLITSSLHFFFLSFLNPCSHFSCICHFHILFNPFYTAIQKALVQHLDFSCWKSIWAVTIYNLKLQADLVRMNGVPNAHICI